MGSTIERDGALRPPWRAYLDLLMGRPMRTTVMNLVTRSDPVGLRLISLAVSEVAPWQ
jgi:hypothetical protein